jgi:putative tricarboxylic transport membrane protein
LIAHPSGRIRTGRLAALVWLADPVLLILVGGAGIGDGLRIIVTKRNTIGALPAGGWIAALGALLIAGSCLYIARAIMHPSEPAVRGAAVLWKPPVLAFTLLALYVALIEPLGYMFSTALFMVIYLRVFGRYRTLAVAAIALPFAIGSAWLWAVMNMMLPQGPIPWP